MKKLFLLLIPFITYSQVTVPTAPQSTQIQHYSNQNKGTLSTMKPPNPMNLFYGTGEQDRIQQQNQQIILEVENGQKKHIETLNRIKRDFREIDQINYNLPSLSKIKETANYRNVFDKMVALNVDKYSIKEVNFDIENAYLENKQDKLEFDKIIKKSGDYILAKMKEMKYDTVQIPVILTTQFQFKVTT
jgi:hypothetical protein